MSTRIVDNQRYFKKKNTDVLINTIIKGIRESYQTKIVVLIWYLAIRTAYMQSIQNYIL